jgi:hypothetical protein
VPLLSLGAYRLLEWQRCLRQASTGEGEGATIARYCKLKEPTYILPWTAPENITSHYFVGREPLSSTARVWNCVVIVGFLFLAILIGRAAK